MTNKIVIDADTIDRWIDVNLNSLMPGKHISVLPTKHGSTNGESCWTSKVYVSFGITLDELIAKEVEEYSRGIYVHFYVDDVLSAMYGTGDIDEGYYLVDYYW